jgi:hypothetical protein
MPQCIPTQHNDKEKKLKHNKLCIFNKNNKRNLQALELARPPSCLMFTSCFQAGLYFTQLEKSIFQPSLNSSEKTILQNFLITAPVPQS